jgi:hypothetical protein
MAIIDIPSLITLSTLIKNILNRSGTFLPHCILYYCIIIYMYIYIYYYYIIYYIDFIMSSLFDFIKNVVRKLAIFISTIIFKVTSTFEILFVETFKACLL